MHTSTYLTDRDGMVVDYSDDEYAAKGICCNCKKTYDMIPTSTGFIPATDLRRILLDYSPHVSKFYEEQIKQLANPMEASDK